MEKRAESASSASEVDDVEKQQPQIEDRGLEEKSQLQACAAPAGVLGPATPGAEKPQTRHQQHSGGLHGSGGRNLPPDHPMHPSKFVGDRFERTAVLTLLGCFCIMFSSFGWINCIGVFQEYYSTHQLKDYSSSTISWIISCELFFMFLGGPFVGKLFDNYGPRYLLISGTCLHVLGLMMASLSEDYYQFLLAQGVCSPIGASMLFFPAMTSCISWFLKRRALAFGVIAGGASIGGVIFPIMVTKLIPRVGFAWTMRTCAFLILGLLTVGNLTIRSRLKPTKKPFSVLEFVKPFQETPFALLNVGAFFGFIGLFIPISYIVVQAQTVGMSLHLQGYLVPILNGASFFGRILPGQVADKIGRFNMMVIMCTISVVFIFAVWIPAKTDATVIAFASLYGFASGAYISIQPTLVAEITKDMSKLGVRNGASFAVISFATLIGSPIAGALIKACKGEFWGLQLFAGVTLAMGTALILATRTTLVGLNLTAKV